MTCEACENEGRRSETYLLTEHVTYLKALVTYDADGNVIESSKMHWRTRRYQCSNGHTWEERERI